MPLFREQIFADAVVTCEQPLSARGSFLANWSPELIHNRAASDYNERFWRRDPRGYLMNGESPRGVDDAEAPGCLRVADSVRVLRT